MAFDYTPLKTTADNLIKQFGQTVTFTRLAETYSHTTGLSSSASTYTADIVLLGESKEQDATGLISESQNALLASSTEPLISDSVVVGSESYRVQQVNDVKPAATVIYYELRLSS